MKAIILAAGKGVRMLPLTLEKPKQLLEVLGKPLLCHIWEALPDVVDEVVLVVGYKGDMIRQYLGNEFLGKKIFYLEQPEPKGTAHALHLCRHLLKDGERFFFLFADDLYNKETLEKCLRHETTMLVAETNEPQRFGIAVVDEKGKVVEFEEKPQNPKSNLASTGAFVLDKRIFDYELELDSKRGEYCLTPLVEKFARDHGIYTVKASLWIPVGYPEDLKKAEKILSQKA